MRSGRITILQVNDTHGYLEPHPELMWNGREADYPVLGGYAVMAGYCRDVREECGGAVLLLDNGDTFHGTYPVVQSKGAAIVPLLDAFGFDAMTAHWDFAWGPQHLNRPRKIARPASLNGSLRPLIWALSADFGCFGG